MIIRRALISVSDKTGIVQFAEGLSNFGIEIFSTGGTANMLADAGINVKEVSELTGFPEILEGRVKTLHPAVHSGLLAKLDNENHLSQIKKQGFESIDLLVVNLYPFEKTLANPAATHDELVENIDIGGPTMLRSAAKNYKFTIPVCNPVRYDEILDSIKNSGDLSEEKRKELAAEIFSHTAYYDSLISGYFNKKIKNEIPSEFGIPMKLSGVLRYGENPHQQAALYGNYEKIFKKLHGKELSYNNILDIDAAAKLIVEFNDKPTVAIIKHLNPCGVATGNTLSDAYEKAFATDTVSPFGGIIAFNREVDKKTAETVHGIFTELLIAPSFSNEALEVLTKKKDRRLIRASYEMLKESLGFDFKSVAGGILYQKTDTELFSNDGFKTVTKRAPGNEELEALQFAWKVCKHVKSNAIVYTSNDRTLAIGAGQMSRVDSSRIAVEKAKLMGISLEGSVCASDAFFPFADGLEQAAEAGATAVIEPGGSIRDEEVIKAADERNIAMIFTGMRHFRH